MATPIEKMLDAVDWKVNENPPAQSDISYATHEGILDIGGFKMRCYRLNTGENILNAEDVERFFGAEIVNEELG